MQYRKLSNTDIEVSTVAFGAWAITGDATWGHQEERDSLAALQTAFEAGVTLFDTAEMYGNGLSEQLIGKALGSVRDEIIIASKVNSRHLSHDQLQLACERSLQALGTDRIDLYQVHWPSREVPITEVLGHLEGLRTQGKIRAYGVSNFGPQDLADCLQSKHRICSNQLAYSLLFRAVEYEIQPLCNQEQVSILCYSSLMQGLLTGKFITADDVPESRARTRHFAGTRPQARHGEDGAEDLLFETVRRITAVADGLGEPMADVSIAWLLAQPGVTSAIIGARNARQAGNNVRGAELALSTDTLEELARSTDALKTRLGSNADMWQSESRIR